ncbi:uncharacterized protein BJ171DRAFT_598285 [Polychytrium aggregatum]|uniref:uncharacterized protein n=1 Tax=Polychytrium aggregatum TaxID=110093 RepID=UPI0022FE054A|nr:uncharacterized protein BJ171DRAFT_598285 [Polychytrium aggregatum]KAI9205618.1 hypothetical protein BJ171DRAFT_598285 [Polychytrium aggregatum]
MPVTKHDKLSSYFMQHLGLKVLPMACKRRSAALSHPVFLSQYVPVKPREAVPAHVLLMAYKTDMQIQETYFIKAFRILHALYQGQPASVFTNITALSQEVLSQPIRSLPSPSHCFTRELLLHIDDLLGQYHRIVHDWSTVNLEADLDLLASADTIYKADSKCRERLTMPAQMPRVLELIAVNAPIEQIYKVWRSDIITSIHIVKSNVKVLESMLSESMQLETSLRKRFKDADTFKLVVKGLGIYDCLSSELAHIFSDHLSIARGVSMVFRIAAAQTDHPDDVVADGEFVLESGLGLSMLAAAFGLVFLH